MREVSGATSFPQGTVALLSLLLFVLYCTNVFVSYIVKLYLLFQKISFNAHICCQSFYYLIIVVTLSGHEP